MRIATAILCLSLLVSVAAAEGMRDSSSVVAVTAAPDTLHAGVGGTVEFTVTMEIQDGWHLYAHGDPVYYGITLHAPEDLPVAALKVDYPKGHEGKFLGEKVQLLEHTETLSVSGLLMVQPEKPLELELELQACDDKSCLAPAWIPVCVTVLPVE